MSYCLNPNCAHPQNPDQSNFCRSCGSKLRLRERYLPIAPLGQGGFGRTFKAIDEDRPGRPVCTIKQFLVQFEGTKSGQKAAELFTQEASVLERLNHPSIPKLLAYFITLDGGQYLVEDFIDGENLEAELQRKKYFSSERIVELLTTLLPALDYIHQLGFIHRDLKPANIIRRAVDGQLFLVDFGAAKVGALDRAPSPGTTIGTPEFMAPEQRWGRAFPASDLYSLGVTCIHLLTGIAPFELFDDRNGWRWRERLTQPIDPQLAAVLDKLIQSTPSERYTTAAEVIAALSVTSTPAPPVATGVKSPPPPVQQSALPIANRMTAPQPLPPIATGSSDWVCTHTFEWHRKAINAMALFANGQFFVSGDDGGTVAIWNLSIPQQPIATYRVNNSVWAVAASPNLSQVASGDKDRKVQLRRKEAVGIAKLELRGNFGNLDTHNGFVYAVEFSPDGKILASGGADRQVKLWNADNGKIIYTLDGHQDAVTALQFMPNGKILVSGGADRTLRFWDIERKQLLKTIDAHERTIHALAIGRDGQTIVSGSSDRSVRVRQLGAPLQQILTGHQEAVLSVAISPDSKTIASGSVDGIVNLWDVSSQQLVHSFQAHQSAVSALVFQPHGLVLMSASWDRKIAVWQSS